MGTEENVAIMIEIFRAIERRDRQRLAVLVQPDVAMRWPPPLLALWGNPPAESWDRLQPIWDDLQPGEAQRRMDPRVVAADGDSVVALWRWRGVSPTGERFEIPVLGVYQLRADKLARAQMLCADTAAFSGFTDDAQP